MGYAIPDRLGWVVLPPDGEEKVAAYVMPLPDGDPRALHGTAALIWVLAADGDADVAAELAALLEVDVAEVREHVEEYLAELVASGLLEVTR